MKYTITNDELVEYLNKVLDSKVYKKIMLSGDIKDTEYFFSLFINVISKYYISTMDDSLKHAEEICYLLYHHTFNEAKSSFMEDVLMDRIVQECSRELGIEDEDKVIQYLETAKLVSYRNQCNSFYTHSFPGAILDDVRKNGLDVSKNGFKEELDLLGKYFKTSFKVGDLYYAELSSASISYATHNIPEKVHYFLGGLHPKDGVYEDYYEMYSRSFMENLDQLRKSGVAEDEIKKLEIAGKKVIDYYCKPKKAGIAFFKRNVTPQEKSYDFDVLNINSSFGVDSPVSISIQKIIEKMKDNPSMSMDIWQDEINQLCRNNPSLKDLIYKVIHSNFAYNFSYIYIPHFSRGGFNDGYALEGGILPREQFGLLETVIPRNYYIEGRKAGIDIKPKKDLDYPDYSLELDKEKIKLRRLHKIMKEDPKDIYSISFPNMEYLYYEVDGYKKIDLHFTLSTGNSLYVSDKSDAFLLSEYIKKETQKYLDKGLPIEEIITYYKTTDSYEVGDEKRPGFILDAIQLYMRRRFYKFSEDEQEKILYQQSLNYPHRVLIRDGEHFLLNSEDGIQEGMHSLLYSTEEDSSYNFMRPVQSSCTKQNNAHKIL